MSPASPERFSNLLADAIQLIAFRQRKNRQAVQDELGYAMGRSGGTAIAYWIYRKRIPARLTDIENLAQVVAQRGGWENPSHLLAFLEASGHPNAHRLAHCLLPVGDPDAASPAGETAQLPPFPFVVGPPILLPRQFFGRQMELKHIFNVLRGPPLQNVAIVGKQRSGKTSLLHHMKNISSTLPAQLRPGQFQGWLPESARYLWVFIDFQDPRMCTQTGFFRHVLSQLQIPLPSPCTLNTFIEAVSQQLSNPAVILMDELPAALRAQELNETFWWGLRSLGANLTEGRMGFVVTSQVVREHLVLEDNSPSPFLNIFGHLIELGPLKRQEAYELVNSSPIPFDPADAEWILETSQCWPALLQLLSMACWTHLEEGRHGEDWKPAALRSIARYQYLLNHDA